MPKKSKKTSMPIKPGSLRKEKPSPEINSNEILEKLKIQSEKEALLTKLRREIRRDFLILKNSGRTDIGDIADFIVRYSSGIEATKQILAEYKNSGDYHSHILWKYLSGEQSELLDKEIVLKKMEQERINWVQSIIPNPFVVKIPINANGPRVDFISKEYVTDLIAKELQGYSGRLEIIIKDFRARVGEYSAQLLLDDDIQIKFEIHFALEQDPLPLDIAQRLSEANDLIAGRDDSISHADIVLFLQNTLDCEPQSDVLSFYPLMGDVLKTAYNYGFWKLPWIQGVYHEWKSKYNEYILNSEIELIRGRIKSLNDIGNLIPDEYDNDYLDKAKIEKIAQDLLNSDVILSSKNLRILFDEEAVDNELIAVSVFFNNLPGGKFLFHRVASFLPSHIRDEIKRADLSNLVRLKNVNSDQDLFKIADQETKHGSELRDENDRPDYIARSNYLAGVCRVLMERGKVESIQFKRTLTHYYAAKGPTLLDGNPIIARFYFLMFYRMMYKESINEHLKAIKPLDYPVLANLIATYLSTKSRLKSPKHTEIKHHPELKPQFYFLWRLGQLLEESPYQFLLAMFDMFQIEDVFIRNVLKNLRIVRRIDVYDLDNLRTDSNELLKYLVNFVLGDMANSEQPRDLTNFIISVLECSEIVKQIENDFQRLLVASNRFVNAKSAVQKSTLYTEVDRILLQCKEAVDRLASQYRFHPDSAKKAGIISRFLNELKNFINDAHHDFFKSASLEAQLDATTLPKGRQSPIDIRITNTESGLATNVCIKLDKNSSFYAEDYTIPISPFYAKESRIETIFITPLADLAIEISGNISFEDQDTSETQKGKVFTFRQTLSVSNPESFIKFKNPYITGRAIQDTNMFFGRRTEMEEIIRALKGELQDRILAIHGERRIGKTSLIFQIKEGDPSILNVNGLENIQKEYVPIYMTFERFTPSVETWLIYYHMYTETYNASQDFYVDPKVTLAGFPHDETSPYFVEDFIVSLVKAAGAKGRKLLFLFDEFDNLIRVGGEERGFFGFLRELIMRYGKETSFIFVGQSTLVEMMKSKANRLYSLANTKEILRLSDDEARALIIDPVRKIEPDFEWAEGAVRQLLYYTEGNPYFIQTLCFHIIEQLIDGKRLRATVNDVEKAVHSAIEGSGELSIALADKIKDSELNKNSNIIMLIVAMLTKDEMFSESWVNLSSIEQKLLEVTNIFPLAIIPSLLQTLVSKGILRIKKSEEHASAYNFQLPLLRLYVLENLNLKDLLKEEEYL